MKKGNNSGFTLVEVVVVVAVIAILAAVLTPYITKYIDDSKIAKAKNEVQVISASLANLYKDTGRWPTSQAAPNAAYLAWTTTAPTTFPGMLTGAWATAANTGNLANHLVTNGPPVNYPATGDMMWRGPYATTIPLDPWGHPYLVYVPAAGAVNPPPPIWVLSAGPNGIVNNAANAPALVNAANNDDIGIRIR
ncbi:MAG TPA: type II secretion system protein GspG [Candidatus Deferrimicrobiaceae bacterium]|jgi:prepilin-type N-terminal cleavage/methylation domain-containing protein